MLSKTRISRSVQPLKAYNGDAPFFTRLNKDIKKNYGAYFLVLFSVIFYIIFSYKPMYGAIIAFKNYSPGKGILGSDWVGLKHFGAFFGSYYFGRLLKNTLTLSLSLLVFGFPAPIIFALLMNEIQRTAFKRTVQTITYMPHFVSLVVACSLVKLFTSDSGFIVQFMTMFGFEPISLLSKSKYFVPVYVLQNIWKEVGWGTIIYLAALSGVDPNLYEAAKIDGAGRWQQTIHVTLPCITSTIVILFIMRMGSIMNVGYENIILLYNEGIYDTADVISTFVFRKGLEDFQWSYSTAVGLFNSVINFALVFATNKISRKVSDVSLW